EEDTMDSTKPAAGSREGSTPGEDNIVKGDKSVKSRQEKPVGSREGGSEPGEDNNTKGDDKGV
ncbi:MAG: hypothetical protein ACRD2T_11935, partial [Thermoanaerobaculia bacterium]